jgi:CheY-like chemotaxis protein
VSELRLLSQSALRYRRQILSIKQFEPELGHLAVIAFTALARDEDRAATRLAGFQAHLVKPIEPDKLVRTVLELFSYKKEGRSTI